MESKVVKSDFRKLEGFMKSLRGAGNYKVRVGIMGTKNNRNDKSGQTNADIGFIHEYGRPATKGHPAIPMRSFLLMPIVQKSDRIISEVVQDKMVKNLGDGNIVEVLTDLGIAAERAILDAFDTGGFGSWRPNAPSTVRRKGSAQPLIDLGFLRKSISSEVVAV